MPRVHHVKKAAKDNPAVQKGEPYYWWKFRYGGKRYSKDYPRASQLTQSPFLSGLYALQEGCTYSGLDNADDLQAAIEETTEGLRELLDMSQESLDNMPEPLQEGDTGQLLQERIDTLEDAISELECIDLEDELDLEAMAEQAESIVEEISL